MNCKEKKNQFNFCIPHSQECLVSFSSFLHDIHLLATKTKNTNQSIAIYYHTHIVLLLLLTNHFFFFRSSLSFPFPFSSPSSSFFSPLLLFHFYITKQKISHYTDSSMKCYYSCIILCGTAMKCMAGITCIISTCIKPFVFKVYHHKPQQYKTAAYSPFYNIDSKPHCEMKCNGSNRISCCRRKAKNELINY